MTSSLLLLHLGLCNLITMLSYVMNIKRRLIGVKFPELVNGMTTAGIQSASSYTL